MNIIITSIITLAAIGLIAAVILYFIAQHFKVEEDPRIEIVEGLLPGANCGGCGKAGCRNFAESCVKADTLDGMLCPVGGNETMKKIASILGKEAVEAAPRVATIRCNGSCQNRPRTNSYEGASSCAITHNLYIGESGCAYGCLGCGDCVSVCHLGAISIDSTTKLPVVDTDKCGGCGACARTCPRGIIEVRPLGIKGRRVYVGCMNKEKGGIARKSCNVACIGCGKCAKECPFDAITISNNLAYIDSNLCKMCRKCVDVCPTGAIQALNFPPKKKSETTTTDTSTQQ
ncbi:MAG: Fe-S cluster domain-containing protein [Bacteroidaceae bacterium]|nr:Fe-S cluster domain-containing protein [Bacteroidaceae bacterium]